jgi:hypothetical protein
MVWYLIALEITCFVIIGVATYVGAAEWYSAKNPTPTPTPSSTSIKSTEITPAYTMPVYTTPGNI